MTTHAIHHGPFLIRGSVYHDLEHVAASLGCEYYTATAAYRRGRMQTLGRVTSRDEGLIPFKVRGRTFNSYEECAAHFGLTLRRIQRAVRSGRANAIGRPPYKTRKRHGAEPMTIKVRGVVYKDRSAAAKALGVSPSAVTSMVAAGRADYIGLGRSRKHNATRIAIPVEIGPLKFPSRKAAARALGCSPSMIAYALDAPPEKRTPRRLSGLARLAAAYAASLSEKRST